MSNSILDKKMLCKKIQSADCLFSWSFAKLTFLDSLSSNCQFRKLSKPMLEAMETYLNCPIKKLKMTDVYTTHND